MKLSSIQDNSPAGPSARKLERLALNINPGGWSVQIDYPIATLLGSCVAVCLFDTQLRLAGMNHFLLPSRTNNKLTEEDIILNGDYAMEVLRNAMYAKGASRSRMVAKAFGGGNVVSSIQLNIGQRNIEFTQEWLKRENIPLIAYDFGGSWSRKLVIDPKTGDAFCRRNSITQPDTQNIIKAEDEYALSLQKKAASSAQELKIELF